MLRGRVDCFVARGRSAVVVVLGSVFRFVGLFSGAGLLALRWTRFGPGVAVTLRGERLG